MIFEGVEGWRGKGVERWKWWRGGGVKMVEEWMGWKWWRDGSEGGK